MFAMKVWLLLVGHAAALLSLSSAKGTGDHYGKYQNILNRYKDEVTRDVIRHCWPAADCLRRIQEETELVHISANDLTSWAILGVDNVEMQYHPVFMVSATYCDKSDDAKRLLNDARIHYKLVNWNRVRRGPHIYMQVVRTFADGRTKLPLIFVCGTYIGDYDDLLRYSEDTRLEQAKYC